jgi:L-ribulose-5-phosphate 4-epimerase
MVDEGVIKYTCNWRLFDMPDNIDVSALLNKRNELFTQKLIGYDTEEKVGYGNISMKIGKGNQFFISGSQTGHIEKLAFNGLSFVIDGSVKNNSIDCCGPSVASSESLTHFSIYENILSANAVIHVHHAGLWKSLLNKVPTSSEKISYGTVEMANEIKRLIKEEKLLEHKILAMAGHKDGVISFGKDLVEAHTVLMDYYNKI